MDELSNNLIPVLLIAGGLATILALFVMQEW